ncbi:MAG: peptidylprolyl isomerase [Kiritimatiellia bacterium]
MKKQVLTCTMILSAAFLLAGCKEREAASDDTQPTGAAVVTPEVAVEGEEDLSAVVVTVNGETLLRGDINRQIQQAMGSPQFAALPPEQVSMILSRAEEQIVNQFIDQTLLRGAADGADITITDEDVDTYIEELRVHFAGGESLEARMAMQGIAMEDLRRDIVADMKIRALLDQVTESVEQVADEQVQAFYDENREMFSAPESVSAKHILVQVGPEADEEAREAALAEITAIREKLLAGEVDFASAAQEHSSCPSGQRGGDLGQFGRGQMVPAFEEAAFAQPIGVVGEVVETNFGYHLILVSERQDASEQSFDAVREDIAEYLATGQKQEVVRAYIEGLREAADIKMAE